MAKKKKQSAKQKQLKRVRQFIRRAEKRGYEWSEDYKQKLKDLSWQKLKTITPEKAYKEAVFRTEYGTVKGTEGRNIERKRAAQKGAQTRKQRESVQKAKQQEYKEPKQTYEYEDWYDEDFSDWAEAEDEEVVYEADAIMNQLIDMITNASGTKAGAYMSNILNDAIEDYGWENVSKALASAPANLLEAARGALYYEEGVQSGQNARKVRAFADLLFGYVKTVSENKELEDIIDGM